MARAKVVHSTDACTIIFKGNPKSPEPSTGVIKFPGGCVEVSRCSDGSYWAHLCRSSTDQEFHIVDSRIDYAIAAGNDIISIPDEVWVEQIAIKIKEKK